MSPREVVEQLGRLTFKEPKATPPPPPAASREARWEQDIDYSLENIAKLHGVPWRYVTYDQFKAKANELKAKVATLTDRQIVCELGKWIAPLGDGHTRVWSKETEFPLRLLPVKFRHFQDGYFITSCNSEQKSLLGAKLLQVDQTPVDKAAELTKGMMTSENKYADIINAEDVFQSTDLLYAAGISKSPDLVELTLRLADGEQKKVVLEGNHDQKDPPKYTSIPEQIPSFLTQLNKNFWTNYLEESNTLYLKYNSCSDRNAFRKLSDEMLAIIDSRSPSRVIIDLRRNGGGNSSIINPFLEGLASRHYTVRGKIFVLTDRYTFSSAFHNTLDARKINAIHLGEAPSQKLNYGGEVRSFTLPNSKVVISYPMKDSPWLSGIDIRAVEPDLTIVPTSSEHFTGKDPVLEAALRFQ